MENVTASVPAYASDVLRHVSQLSTAASLVPIHAAYLPIPPLTLIHAMVVSHNSLLITGYFTHNKGRVNLTTSVFFNQLLLFGPLSVLSAMLAQPCPVLIAPEFIYIYAGVHLVSVLSGVGASLVALSQVSGTGLLIDTVAALVDAFARTDGIAVLGVEVVRTHPNPIVSSSPFAALLIGTGVGVGSLLMLGLISFEKLEWSLRKPLWLQTPSLLIGADYISSFLATLAYYVLTSPKGVGALVNPIQVAPVLDVMQPYVLPVLPYAAAISSSVLETLQVRPSSSTSGVKASLANLTNGPLLSAAEARALGAAIVFAFSFGNRLRRSLPAKSVSTGRPISSDKRVNGSLKKTLQGSSPLVAQDVVNIDANGVGGDSSAVKASARKSTGAKKRK